MNCRRLNSSNVDINPYLSSIPTFSIFLRKWYRIKLISIICENKDIVIHVVTNVKCMPSKIKNSCQKVKYQSQSAFTDAMITEISPHDHCFISQMS